MGRSSYRVFGKDTNPTIYYLLGNAGRTRMYSPHIVLLSLFGYRIVAFEYEATVLSSGEPERLLHVLKEITEVVKKDQAKRQVAGLYGVSLGTFLGMNVMARTGIKKGMFNTGPANLVQVIWDATGFTPIKDSFKMNGYNRQDLTKAWQEISVPAILNLLEGSEILNMNSQDDHIITFDNYQATERLLVDRGIAVRRITTKRYGHVVTIIRNMCRLRTTVNFFR